MATPKSIPTSKCSLFSISLPTLISCLFDSSHSNRCEVISHCGFDLHFPMTSDVEHLQIPIGQLCLLWKNVYLVPQPILKLRLFDFLLLHCMSSLCILGIIIENRLIMLVLYFVNSALYNSSLSFCSGLY